MNIEDRWLEPGYYLALEFDSGYHVVRILGREPSGLKDYNLAYNSSTTTHATVTTTADWDEATDSAGRYYLEPQTDHRDNIYQIFWGGWPISADIQFFMQFLTREDRWSLIGTRAVPGDVGYLDSEATPYNNPSIQSELFTMNEIHPAFKVYNATLNTQTIYQNFMIMKYLYQPIKDEALIRELLTPGQRRCKKYVMGGIDKKIRAPNWWAEKFVGVAKTFEELGIE